MKKTAGLVLAVLLAVYALLHIPDPEPQPAALTGSIPFAWNCDDYWYALEDRYRAAKQTEGSELQARIDRGLQTLALLIDSVETCTYEADDPIFDKIESVLFELCPDIAACQVRFTDFLASFNDLRRGLKKQSGRWDMNDTAVRHRLYRLLYGGRTAVEQIMLQVPPDSIPTLSEKENVSSATPSANVLGVTIHSGDILVSRGGAPTSALIARGNDYPGNFSHVALVHVDPETERVSIIEAHIEVGVAIATPEQYLNDTKLRVMVLRLRPDLPALQTDPQLPHKAACLSLQRAQREHIPYDFEMDFEDPEKLFCSEVASDAYSQVGITLWMGLSHISSAGVASWLAAFGVTHFETQEPSDLEYDPQLRVVAEWRDPETLFKDQIDNAVVDVMLEGAEDGEDLRYAWYRLPAARLAKAYSAALNTFGKIGPVPEGMSAIAGLRNQWFSTTHSRIKARVILEADQFKQQNSYTPPYWELVKLAREAKRELM